MSLLRSVLPHSLNIFRPKVYTRHASPKGHRQSQHTKVCFGRIFFCKITIVHDCAESGRRQRNKGQKLRRQHHQGHSKFIMLGIVSVETDLREVNEDLFSSFF